jgi:hypothetical protein
MHIIRNEDLQSFAFEVGEEGAASDYGDADEGAGIGTSVATSNDSTPA